MKKLFAVLALTGTFAAGSFTAVALAQKDPKKPDPKTAAKGVMAIKPDAKGKYRLYVRNADGDTLLMSAGAGFKTEDEAKEAFEEVKAIVGAVKVTVEKADPDKDK